MPGVVISLPVYIIGLPETCDFWVVLGGSYPITCHPRGRDFGVPSCSSSSSWVQLVQLQTGTCLYTDRMDCHTPTQCYLPQPSCACCL